MKAFITSFFLLIFLASCQNVEIKVACVGDSITEGAGIQKQSEDGYPVVLDHLLGGGYSVLNCGRSAATMLRSGNLPYWKCNELSNVFAYNPDIIIIKLGTNDSKPINWNEELFKEDYQSMIDTFRSLPSNPDIFLCLPVPAYQIRWGINDSTITAGVIPTVQSLAEENQLQVIDLYSALADMPELFPDGIHPNEKGAALMAESIAEVLKNRYGTME